MERYTEQLLSTQQSLGRDTYSIRKCKSNLALGKGPALVAAENVYLNDHMDNRIQAVTKDQFYQPIDSRNRLSINWYPDFKKSESIHKTSMETLYFFISEHLRI